jgi:hypothetical protein
MCLADRLRDGAVTRVESRSGASPTTGGAAAARSHAPEPMPTPIDTVRKM